MTSSTGKRVLMGASEYEKSKKVHPDSEQCEKIGAIIGKLSFRDNFYQREFLQFPCNTETKLWAYFAAVAICHQTHILRDEARNLYGWEYLENVYMGLAKEGSELLDPAFLISESPLALGEKLCPLFSPDGSPGNCTLDRLEERGALLIQMSKVLVDNYGGQVSRLLRESRGRVLGENETGLYARLDAIEAYRDPLKKKSTFLIKLLMEADLCEVQDPENFIPIMDYHMQRVLLRTGCVEVLDSDLADALRKRTLLPSDLEVRSACIDAIKIITNQAQHPITKMNDVFWTLGRSCCMEEPLCTSGKCHKDPCTFFLAMDIETHDKCIFEEVCPGKNDKLYRSYWQPEVETHYY